MMTIQGSNPGGSHNAFELEEPDNSSCGSGAPFRNYQAFSAVGEIDEGRDCSSYPSKCSDSPTSSYHSYGPGDCINNWCRVEVCLATRGQGGNLGVAGAGPYWAESYVQPLGGGAESFVRTYMGDSSWDSCKGGGGACTPDNFGVNMLIDTGSDSYWISHVMQARWSTDAGQRIGAASEFEGGGSSGPAPVGPVCGDGTRNSGEECDDGNTVSGDGCSATCVVEAAPPPPPPSGGGGTGGTGVLLSDDFEGTLSSVLANWGNGTSDPSRVSLVNDHPASSPGSKSLQLNAGTGGTAYLFKQLPGNYDRLYYRYYVKYEGTSYHHTGAMIGGYLPATGYPQGDAGLKGVRPNGDRLLNLSFETLGSRLDFYNNWIDMQGPAFQGQYYGRNLLQDLNIAIPNQWTCVEIMVSMNTPATASNGELAVWINDNQAAHFRPGAPNGYWDGTGNWRMNSGSPAFPGFRWRDTASLGLNWVKLQNYDAAPRVWFDDVVVSTARVGCNGQPTTPSPTAPPAPVLLP